MFEMKPWLLWSAMPFTQAPVLFLISLNRRILIMPGVARDACNHKFVPNVAIIGACTGIHQSFPAEAYERNPNLLAINPSVPSTAVWSGACNHHQHNRGILRILAATNHLSLHTSHTWACARRFFRAVRRPSHFTILTSIYFLSHRDLLRGVRARKSTTSHLVTVERCHICFLAFHSSSHIFDFRRHMS